MPEAGPLNTICDVPGIQVGNAEDHAITTGVTVILPDRPAVCAVDHRGGGIGSRDTAVLAPGSSVPTVHAITLSGGSAYGLDAAGGVMHGLRQDGQGFSVSDEIVPIVPSAIIFDLLCGDGRGWDRPPWWDLGFEAYRAAGSTMRLGNAGAGLGATAGALKGGLGSASYVTDEGTVGALAVVNPIGSVLIPATTTFWSWMHEQHSELGGQRPPSEPLTSDNATNRSDPLANTTLAVVATDITLTREQAMRMAIMAQDGLARAIRPVHGALDGDTVFVLSTAQCPCDPAPEALTSLGNMAADCVARAIARGVYEAETMAGWPSYQDWRGSSVTEP